MRWLDVAEQEGMQVPCWNVFAQRYNYHDIGSLASWAADSPSMGLAWLMENRWSIVEEGRNLFNPPTSVWLDQILNACLNDGVELHRWTTLCMDRIVMYAFEDATDAVKFRLLVGN